MFQSEELNNHLQTSHTIETRSLVYAEWNLNQPDNIARLGNYRYRPASSDTKYATIPYTYDINDEGNYYTGATDADILIDGGYDDNGDPVYFTQSKNKMKMLYSLEDCFKPFRPRSGINKVIYLGTSGEGEPNAQYVDATTANSATRPRYYISSRYDQFKYWTSFRNEVVTDETVTPIKKIQNEYGVSRTPINGRSYIYDACPFIVYKDDLAINRLIFKMQTNVGTTDIGPIRVGTTTDIPDPLFGIENQTTPTRWRIDVLKGTSWITIKTFDENSQRSDGTQIIGPDGYLELSYGLKLPEKYKDVFVYAGTLSSANSLPTSAPQGYAYLIKENETDRGIFSIYYDAGWTNFYPEYYWDIAENFISKNSNFVSDLTNPDYFIQQEKTIYREIDIINGIRIVIDTMNKTNCTFDLIEMSPRLAVDLTDRVQQFSISKTLSDLGNGSIPVGALLAGTGDILINNNDFAFNSNNEFNIETKTGSLIAKYLLTNTKFSFYEIVKNVEGYDYYIPLKTLYSEGFPQSQANFDQIQMSLRDGYFMFESNPAPSLMVSDISLSNAIMILLDYIGFTNYVFKRVDGQQDPIIPYFFVAPNQNVAEILNQLAVATQCAMFFDEYNNFVIMTKEYLLPENNVRSVDLTLFGNEIDDKLPNIISISSANKNVNNSGSINYTKRYIQRSYGSTRQAMYNDEFKTWTYVPTLLWEVSGDQTTKTQNDNSTQQSAYSLAAMPLASDLSSAVPTVINNNMTNNIIYVGENIYYYARYNGYLYANGEIIKYDAIQYSITGQTEPIWINNVDEYQEYFSNLPFNGKIYPTGNIRIWSEPEYITVNGITIMKPGEAKQHGRGQFGTPIVEHKAGLDAYWSEKENVYGCKMQSGYLFAPSDYISYPVDLSASGSAGVDRAKSLESTRTGIIKNIGSEVYLSEKQLTENTVQRGTLQSSALVFSGPNFETADSPRDYVSYVYKPLNNAYKHFGTRMRIIGKVESGSTQTQTPIGNTPYINIPPTNTQQQVSINGGSGGIAMMIDKNTNSGYYFEICALTTNNISQYQNSSVNQKVSYEIKSGASVDSSEKVTINTTKIHEFSVGENILISGLSKDYMNGSFYVTDILSPTSLKYQINTKFIVTKTSLTSNKATITTSQPHNFFVGQQVTISGIRLSANIISKSVSASVATITFDNSHRFNIGDYVEINGVDNIFNGRYLINAKTASSISYEKSVDNISTTTCTGTAILSWKNSYSITNKQIVSNVATLTFSSNHSFVTGDIVSINGVGLPFDGMYQITATPATNKISYSKINQNIVSTSVVGGTAIKELFDPVYNGTFNITNVEGNTFSFNKTNANIAENQFNNTSYIVIGNLSSATSTTAGNATRNFSSSAKISNIYFYKMMQGQQTFNVENNGLSISSNIMTVNTTLPHGFVTGDSITINNIYIVGSTTYQTISGIVTGTPTTTSFTIAYTHANQAAFGGQYMTVYTVIKEAIPYKLWSGLANILVDSGRFVGQYRTVAEKNPTVYDLAIEYKDVGSVRIFYLYINNKQIATVTDDKPLTKTNNMAVFVRGSSKCMFENIYAIAENYADNPSFTAINKIAEVFGDEEINSSEALRKYAVNGFIQAAYLNNISTYEPPKYNIYYDEFGTIMREVAHFNIKYDRAYPALYARLAPTLNRIKTYSTSGFYAGAYGADFLVFNCTDKTINLDATSGNFLRIQGIVFTQNTTKTLSVDDYFNKVANLSDPQFDEGNLIYSPLHEKEVYDQIKISRIRHGIKEFTIESPYIQSDSAANNIMGWIIGKTMTVKQNIGLTTFATQTLQLGDMVNLYYKDEDGLDFIAPETKNFVVYNIQYNRTFDGINTTIYLAEV